MPSRKHWLWIAFGLGFLTLLLTSEGARDYWKRKRYLRKLEAQLKQVQAGNRNLTLEIHRLDADPRAIDKIARRDLGLIQPGEVEYRFIADRSSE